GHRCNTGLTVVAYYMEEGRRPVAHRLAPANRRCQRRSAKELTAISCDQPTICISAPVNSQCQRRSTQTITFLQLELTGVSRTYIDELQVNRK
ncbi:hypothetical protein HAX54_023927, partial [Datura stramonium]|nr:hypothetical protein [Datura stramonium]